MTECTWTIMDAVRPLIRARLIASLACSHVYDAADDYCVRCLISREVIDDLDEALIQDMRAMA